MVVNIPPDGRIYSLGNIPGAMHIYNTGRPGNGEATRYHLTIMSGGYYNQLILPGHTDSYHPNDNVVYIQNDGPSMLQVLYIEANEVGHSPEEAGWTTVDKHPEV